MREGSAVLVCLAGDVDHADQRDAGKRGAYTDQLAQCEALDAQERAAEQCPDGGCAREDGAGSDGGVGQAGGGEIVCEEPEDAELQG